MVLLLYYIGSHLTDYSYDVLEILTSSLLTLLVLFCMLLLSYVLHPTCTCVHLCTTSLVYRTTSLVYRIAIVIEV